MALKSILERFEMEYKESVVDDFQEWVWRERREVIKRVIFVNPLNAELNPICHPLILIGDLTFMGPCIVSIFQYISNKMQRYTV